MLNGRNVLNKKDRRPKHFRRSRHSGVESIAWIVPPCMVVKVGVPLTGWSSDKDVDTSYGCPYLLLRESGPTAKLPVEEFLHETLFHAGGREVVAIYGDGVLIHVHRETDVNAETPRARSFCNT
jgi:hypothetical protein